MVFEDQSCCKQGRESGAGRGGGFAGVGRAGLSEKTGLREDLRRRRSEPSGCWGGGCQKAGQLPSVQVGVGVSGRRGLLSSPSPRPPPPPCSFFFLAWPPPCDQVQAPLFSASLPINHLTISQTSTGLCPSRPPLCPQAWKAPETWSVSVAD